MANYISDKSTSGTDERISIVAKKKEYRDLDLSLELHPIRKDITPVRDSEAIKNAIRNILSTEMFERPFQPDLGASLNPSGITTTAPTFNPPFSPLPRICFFVLS